MTLFLTAEEIINIAFEDKNFSKDWISDNVIIECQDGNLREALGKIYYKELLLQFGTNTLTDANKYVIETYLKKSVSYYVKSKMYAPMSAKINNAGINQNTPDPYTTAAHPANAQRAQQAAEQSGEYWLRECLNYMEDDDNSSNYPTYMSNRPTDEPGAANVGTFAGWLNLRGSSTV
jgi:hypothetical protein